MPQTNLVSGNMGGFAFRLIDKINVHVFASKPLRRSLAVVMLLAFGTIAYPQVCTIDRYVQYVPPGLDSGYQYGTVIATNDEWVAVGAPGYLQHDEAVGSAFLYRITDGKWKLVQQLFAIGGVGPGRFGSALALYKNLLIVGAPDDRGPDGAASYGAIYVFQLNGTEWIFQEKVQAFGTGIHRRFGMAVTVNRNLLVVGGNSVVDGTGGGAAYTFTWNDGDWTPEQKLRADVPTNADLFGATVRIQGDRLLIGCPYYDTPALNCGALFVFRRIHNLWMIETRFSAPDATAQSLFGSALSIDGNVALIGAPSTSESGGAYIFDRVIDTWFFRQKLAPIGLFGGSRFGKAVDIKGDTILVGAPNCAVPIDGHLQSRAGVACLFRLIAESWVHVRTYKEYSANYAPISCWSKGVPYWTVLLHDHFVGDAVAISTAGSLVGAAGGYQHCVGPSRTGALNVYAQHETDCDSDGAPDFCDVMPIAMEMIRKTPAIFIHKSVLTVTWMDSLTNAVQVCSISCILDIPICSSIGLKAATSSG